jgi:hypothetical protein
LASEVTLNPAHAMAAKFSGDVPLEGVLGRHRHLVFAVHALAVEEVHVGRLEDMPAMREDRFGIWSPVFL